MKSFLITIFSLLVTFSIYGQRPRIVKDINPGSESAFVNNSEFIRTSFDDKVLFSLTNNDTGAFELWVSDGEDAQTTIINTFAEPVEEFGNILKGSGPDMYFTTYDGDSSRLYHMSTSDFAIEQLHIERSRILNLTMLNESLYFYTSSGDQDFKRFDLSDNSFSIIFEFGFFGIREISKFQNELVIIAANPTEDGTFLYFSDGTQGDARAVKLLNLGSEFSRHYHFTEVGDKLFFFFEASDTPYQLFVTDGTEAGTEALFDFEDYSFVDIKLNRSIIGWNDKLYFRGNTPGNNSSGGFLFVSDGTISGTTMLDINNGADSNPRNFTPFNGELYFQAESFSGIYDIYKTNGTQAGTIEAINASDLGAGLSFGGDGLTVHDDALFFSAWRREVGTELWQSDGTTANTVAFDEVLGEDGINPRNITSTGGFLFFTADKDETGRELFVFDPDFTSSTKNLGYENFVLHPNPAQNEIRIKNTENRLSYSIYSLEGKMFKSGILIGNSINVEDLNKGIWFINISSDTFSKTLKFVKE